jgi:5-methylcytosine-specific restriction endonuclease McrA
MAFARGGPVRRELRTASWIRSRDIVRARDRGVCQACGAKESAGSRRRFPVGHKVPPERWPGGHDDVENLVLLCFACNLSQGGQDYVEWLAKPYGRPALIRGNARPAQGRTVYSDRRTGVVTRDYSVR